MTETELVLGSLTAEELDDANRFVSTLADSWRTSSRVGSTPFRTDGPSHAIVALRLAVLREMTARGGAEPWYAGMPTTDHIGGRVLDLYARRYGMREQEAAASPAGVLQRVCVICGEAKPQDTAHFPRDDGWWTDICHECRRVDPERLRAVMELAPSPESSTDIPRNIPDPVEQPFDDELLAAL